jgi:hypothetical protein
MGCFSRAEKITVDELSLLIPILVKEIKKQLLPVLLQALNEQLESKLDKNLK